MIFSFLALLTEARGSSRREPRAVVSLCDPPLLWRKNHASGRRGLFIGLFRSSVKSCGAPWNVASRGCPVFI